MVTRGATMTVLVTELADLHEQTSGAGCLTAPDGITCCTNRATHRITLEPMPGHDDGPETFACPEHVPALLMHPAVQSIREVRRHAT